MTHNAIETCTHTEGFAQVSSKLSEQHSHCMRSRILKRMISLYSKDFCGGSWLFTSKMCLRWHFRIPYTKYPIASQLRKESWKVRERMLRMLFMIIHLTLISFVWKRLWLMLKLMSNRRSDIDSGYMLSEMFVIWIFCCCSLILLINLIPLR